MKGKCNDDAATDDHDGWEIHRAGPAIRGPLRLIRWGGGTSRARSAGNTWKAPPWTGGPEMGTNSWTSFRETGDTPRLGTTVETSARASGCRPWRTGEAPADANGARGC
jgi:hypothetical protein